MKTRAFLFFLSLAVLVQCTIKDSRQLPPLAQVNPVEDDYYGIKITDPYRYMENLQDSNVQRWIKEQSDYSRSILYSISGRQELIDKMIEFDERETGQISWLKITENNRYFYLKTMPEDKTGKLFYRDGFQGIEILLFDPLTFHPDTSRTYILTNITPSDDGTKVFFVLYPADREGNNIIITQDIESKKIVEQIDRAWMSIASWLPDGRSYLINLPNETALPEGTPFFYDSRICLHHLGADPNSDKEIFSRTKYPELGIKPEDIPNATYDKNSQYIFCSLLSTDRRNHVFYAPVASLSEEKLNWNQLFKREDEVYNFIATDKELYVLTPKDANNFKILKTSLIHTDLANAEVVVPEDPQASITSFRLTREGIYFSLLQNGVQNELYHLFNGENEAVKIELPYPALNMSISTKGFNFSDVWIDTYGWAGYHQRYLYLPYKNEFQPENLSTTKEYPEYTDLIVENLMIKSHDSVKVPLTLIYSKSIDKIGKNYVLLSGYGAYGMLTNSIVDPNLLLWVYKGGILAIAHVRGGGELGDHWHESGMKTTKPNTWKDFIACTEYLIAEKYTCSQKIAITSSSAGGILIGRAMTERPDLFAAAIPRVAFLNPVRLEILQISPYQVYEFGNIKDSNECMALIEMDPYLHLTDDIKYPATLVTAGMIDPMIPHWMPAKFAARLQSVNASDKPILYWANPEAGHLGVTKKQHFEALADVLSFALWQTGHPDFQIK